MARRISDDDLLAFIEGELPAERQEEVRRALEGEPDLLAWAEGAREDRAALQEWGRPGASIAPPDLVEQAMRQAERDALLGAAGLDDAPAPRVLFRFTGPRTALAAMLVAAIGLGFLYGPGLVQQWRGSTSPASTPAPPTVDAPADTARADARSERFNESRLAMAEEESAVDALGAAPAGQDAGRRQADMDLAMKSRAEELASTVSPTPTEPNANGVPMQLALAPTVDALADEADPAVARLAEGAPAPTRLRAIGEMREQGAGEGARRASLSLDEAARLADARRLLVRVEATLPAAIATELRMADAQGLRLTPIESEDDDQSLRLLIETPPGADGLNGLLHALGSLGVASVQMTERAAPIGTPPAQDASDVLWWTLPPASWPGMGSALELQIAPARNVPPPPPGD